MDAKKVKVGINNEDQISSLPDGVLCHILSFLPTKNSVNTRILSTRWTHLFKFVPILDFEYGRIRSDPDSPVNTVNNFIQFVNSVFILYKVSSMNKFRFYFSDSQQDPDNYPIFSWLSSAIDRSVQQINICISFGGPWTLPRDLFSCKTLTNLVLQGSFRIVLPSSVCLPCLKTCSLVRVVIKDESARKLFRSCSVLEKLRLNSCDMREGVEVLDISVPTLKHFFIHACDDFQIVLNVPNLTDFEYVAEGPTSNEFLGLETLKSLVEAIIYYEQESDITDNASIELVWGISHVQELCLYCGPMEAFLRSGHSLPTFNNLTRLILGPMSNLSSQLLSDLLDKSPQLEFISFNQRYGDELDGADQNNYVLPGHVPTCVSLHLKEVEFRYFSMAEYECKLIKYFLKNAKKLKKMQIQSNLVWDEQFEIGSEICQVVFDSDGVEED